MMELARRSRRQRSCWIARRPVASLMVGRKVTALYQRVFGELALEDLWTPCFAISSGLSRAAAVVHERGPVWHAVRASTALPAIFPPLVERRRRSAGGRRRDEQHAPRRDASTRRRGHGDRRQPDADARQGQDLLLRPEPVRLGGIRGRLRLFGSRVRSPGILGSVMRATEINSANRMRTPAFRALADLLIEPAVEAFPILAFDEIRADRRHRVPDSASAERSRRGAQRRHGWCSRRSDWPRWGRPSKPQRGPSRRTNRKTDWRPEHESNVRPAP